MFALALTFGSITGCFEHTIAVGGGAPTAPIVNEQQWQNFWLGGLVGHTRVDLERWCPSGRATVEAKQTFLNGLVAGLTSGLYTPTTLRVRCHDGQRADREVELSAQDMANIAMDDGLALWVGHEFPDQVHRVTAAQAAAEQP